MVFSSPLFLFLFLPIVLGAYYIAPCRLRNALLLAASLLFYTWGEGLYALVMIAIIVTNYALGLLIGASAGKWQSKVVLTVGVIADLAFLVAFKYSQFLVEQLNIILTFLHVAPLSVSPVRMPLGISFFTFHAVSYIVDTARGKLRSGKLLDFALYMTFFPHAIAGPIVRYGDIAAQLRERVFSTAEFAEGVRRFIIGLGKKVLISNSVALTANRIFALPDWELNFSLSWLGIACYTIQIYFDFSGYSDMAIGLAKMFGIDFIENFQYPYIAQSLTEFWRRWHISLSTWFRDYLYIPLGGNRKGSVRTYGNLLIVFLLCGLWHGASWTFALWGLFHGLFLVLERLGLSRRLDSSWKPVRHIYTLIVIAAGWVLFRADNLHQAVAFLGAMAGFGPGKGVAYHTGMYLDMQVVLALLAGVIGSTPVLPRLGRLRNELLQPGSGVLRGVLHNSVLATELAALTVVLWTSSMLLAAGTYNPFIYFRF